MSGREKAVMTALVLFLCVLLGLVIWVDLTTLLP